MKKAIIISVQPKWCELIASGKKTIEVRKTKPKIEVPFKCYIYATRSKRDGIGRVFSYSFRSGIAFEVGKVIGEFVCDNIDFIPKHRHCDCNPFDSMADCEICKPRKELCNKSCLFGQEIIDYLGYDAIGYAWHISDLVIYDKPKELSEFYPYVKTRRQGYRYCKRIGCFQPEYCKYYQVSENDCWRLSHPPKSWQYVEELE